MIDPLKARPGMAHAIRAHAQAAWPEEACGIITGGAYLPFRNMAHDPREDFDCTAQLLRWQTTEVTIDALVHSHANGRDHPTQSDVAQQTAMDIPWGLVVCNQATGEPAYPFFWGDMLDSPPVLGRDFRWGPSGTDGKGDCAALIRDVYINEFGIMIPEFPRDSGWVRTPLRYAEALTVSGFRRADATNPRDGDVVLFRVRQGMGNHAGIYRKDGMILHHQEGRLSAIEPLVTKLAHIDGWYRHALLGG